MKNEIEKLKQLVKLGFKPYTVYNYLIESIEYEVWKKRQLELGRIVFLIDDFDDNPLNLNMRFKMVMINQPTAQGISAVFERQLKRSAVHLDRIALFVGIVYLWVSFNYYKGDIKFELQKLGIMDFKHKELNDACFQLIIDMADIGSQEEDLDLNYLLSEMNSNFQLINFF